MTKKALLEEFTRLHIEFGEVSDAQTRTITDLTRERDELIAAVVKLDDDYKRAMKLAEDFQRQLQALIEQVVEVAAQVPDSFFHPQKWVQ